MLLLIPIEVKIVRKNKCVEAIHQQPKCLKHMVKTWSSPQREIGYGDIEWDENLSGIMPMPVRFRPGAPYKLIIKE